jgi:endonuclease YncB( thermonuclease family)
LAGWNAVDREELIGLLTEALMRDSAFRPHRRHWAADADRRRLEAEVCAAGLVEHLYPRHPLVAPAARAAAQDKLMFRSATAFAAALLAALARPSFADVAGPATVIDGDTIVVAGSGPGSKGSTRLSCIRSAPPTASGGRAAGARPNG